jgi:uncharacterized repeat protein (TIGR03803 family)
MKRLILIIFLSVFAMKNEAQTIWLSGIAGGFGGGASNPRINENGVIYKVKTDNTGYEDLFFFGRQITDTPDNVIEGPDGKLYGTTYYCGDYNEGTLFSFDPSTKIYKILHHFHSSQGVSPIGRLLLASNGKLYGTTEYGGSKNAGTAFCYNIATAIFRKIGDFIKSNGQEPVGNLIESKKDGLIYGITTFGGAYISGSIFTIDPNFDYNIDMVFSFGNGKGGNPEGGLMEASDGSLYGAISRSTSSNDKGAIFRYLPLTKNYINEFQSFHDTLGTRPAGNLIDGKDGKLYGVCLSNNYSTSKPCIFSYDLTTKTVKALYHFDNKNGYFLNSSLLLKGRKLYGTTKNGTGGTAGNLGMLYSYDLSTNNFKWEHVFMATEGTLPGNVCLAKNGKLYGVTQLAAADLAGSLYSFDTLTALVTKHIDFKDNTGSGSPIGNLVLASNGKMYGTNTGTFFSFDTLTSVFRQIKRFEPSGISFYYPIIEAIKNKLYGTDPNGKIFCYDILTDSFTTIPTGLYRQQGLAKAKNGKLYGISNKFNDNGKGDVFCIDPQTNAYTYLVDLESDSTIYGNAERLLTAADNGKLYGVSTDGVVFDFDPVGNKLARVVFIGVDTMNNALGASPLTRAANGKLYGIAQQAGFYTYSIDPKTNTFTKIDDTPKPKAYPNLPFLLASDEQLYSSSDIIYQFNTTTNKYTFIREFVDPPEAYGVPVELAHPNIAAVQEYTGSLSCIIYPNPTSGSFILKSDKAMNEIKIIDVLGHVIYETNIASNQWEIKLEHAGLYIAVVRIQDRLISKKIIVRN